MAANRGPTLDLEIAGFHHVFSSETQRLRFWAENCRGARVEVRREPKNKHDKNACAVFLKRRRIGYIPRDWAEYLAPRIDQGQEVAFFIGDFGYQQGGIQNARGLTLRGFLL